MSANLSIAQMQAQLEARVAHHRDQEAFHAQQEVFHREQKTFHAAELQTATERLESFQAAATAAGEFVGRQSPAAAPGADFEPGPKTSLSPLIAQVLKSKAPDETFGPSEIAKEIHKRWGTKLQRRIDVRNVAATLRRWALAGRIHLVREGKAHQQSIYRLSRLRTG
ncbi:MAG TPA: DUF3253 domain-containing protein [Thermoanaerobaculia bacterium]